MRKGVAGLILGLALVVASVSWASFIMSRTILDPGRSERLADQLFENPDLRAVLADRLSASLARALPAGVEVSDESLDAAADAALDNAGVQSLIRDGIVATHRSALEGNVQPIVLDGQVIGEALRSSLVAANPSLDAVVPATPSASVELPTSGLNILGPLRDFVDQFTVLTGAIALIGGAIALVISSNRPAILRRVSFWAFGASLFWLIVGFGVPRAAELIGPASTALVTAAIDVFFGAMIPPAIAMAAVGAALLGASFLWSGLGGRQPATTTGPSRAPRAAGAQPAVGRMSNISPPVRGQAAGRPGPSQSPDQTIVQPRPQPRTGPGLGTDPNRSSPERPTARPGPGVSTSRTGQIPRVDVDPPDPWAAENRPPEAPLPDDGPRWVEGQGYVDGDGRPNRSVFDDSENGD